MLIKKIFIPIIFFAVTAILFGEDLEFITVRKTMLSKNSLQLKEGKALFEIDKGTNVSLTRSRTIVKDTEDNSIIFGKVEYDGKEYYIDCADLIPANTVNTFDTSLISDLNGSNRKVWIPSYNLKVLQSNDRNTVLLLNPYWEQKYDPYDVRGNRKEWYEYLSAFKDFFGFNILTISNTVLVLNESIYFIIKNIVKTNNGYAVTVQIRNKDYEDYLRDLSNWDNIKDKEFFDMILCVDGEYMDVYLDDMEHKLETFVLVDQIFMQELRTLIEENHADLSKIKSFPRRADGSMDYPPPLDMTNYKATHRVMENMRLRDTADTDSKVVTTMPEGTEVQLVETGSTSTINGITAPWVKVVSNSGYTGWCFSGYLEEIKGQSPAVSVNSNEGKNKTRDVKNKAESLPLPLWAWIAIIGGSVVIVGGVTLFVLKRKK